MKRTWQKGARRTGGLAAGGAHAVAEPRGSTSYWWDAQGRRRTVHQGEGCEQGDALAPALDALGQHDALVAADEQLRSGECLAAFLDNVYPVTTPARAREALDGHVFDSDPVGTLARTGFV